MGILNQESPGQYSEKSLSEGRPCGRRCTGDTLHAATRDRQGRPQGRPRFSNGYALGSLIALLPSICWGWGELGHRLVNRKAIEAVPIELRYFYGKHASVITQRSTDPDKWRDTDPEEGSRHFYHLDFYGLAPLSHPEALGRYGVDAILENGFLPWRVTEFYQKLVDAFQRKDEKDIVSYSAWLGHYVADAHQPFHTTKNGDGQLTGNHGIHSRYETKLLLRHRKNLSYRPRLATKVPVQEFIPEMLRISSQDVAPLLKADTLARKAAGGREARYYRKFWSLSGPMMKKELSRASTALASLWYSAWIEAGRPSL